MKEENEEDRRQRIALFRYGLIADLVDRELGQKGLYAKLREKAGRSYLIPYSRRTRVSEETLRDWLCAWRRGGFDALRPKVRGDVGRTRGIPGAVADLLVSIKDEERTLSVVQVIEKARGTGRVPEDLALPNSTVHRLLSRAGMMRKRPEEPNGNDRRRFSYELANELWMADVMHGPTVGVGGGRRQKSYLVGILDDATRVVPYCAFTFSEAVGAFLPVFGQAVRRRGVPVRLYCDNGAAFRSHQLELACARLGIHLIHSRPHTPEGRGKIERFFRTVRMQLLPRLTPEDTKSLEAINRALWGYIEGEYHQTPHRGLSGETPLDRWCQSADGVRLPRPDTDIDALFLLEEKRRVQRDRTVSLRGVLYEVDATLVGETVTLKFDPGKIGEPVEVWYQHKKVGMARRVDLYANCFVKRNPQSKVPLPGEAPEAPPKGLRLRDFPPGDNPREGGR
jgi:transposase InsO family protein